MNFIHGLFSSQPLLALFITIALGYLVGKIKIGSFVLGGIAGTLLVGVLIGQLGVEIAGGIKGVFFALFIYAVGFQGGPQFFHALNRHSLNQLASAFVMCFTGLLCVLVGAWAFDLDRGMAAGLAAGGLTQSAIIGTAGDAIAKLGLAPDLIKTMQTNVAVGYAVCYIFGSLGPILMVSWLIPLVMKWNIRREAVELASALSGGHAELDPGEFNAAKQIATRFYRVAHDSKAVGKTPLAIDKTLSDASVEAIYREGKTLSLDDAATIQSGDRVAITARSPRSTPPPSSSAKRSRRPSDWCWSRRIANSSSPQDAQRPHDQGHPRSRERRNPPRRVPRLGAADGPRPAAARQAHGQARRRTPLHRQPERSRSGGGEDRLQDHRRSNHRLHLLRPRMMIGLLIGMIEFRIFGVPISIGSGGGCLLSGLMFGWLRSVHPKFAALPLGASTFLRDFGLAVFVGIVGISAGPQALVAIQNYGFTLFFLGVGVTLVPQVVTFFFSYFVLRIRNPIEALACVAGDAAPTPPSPRSWPRLATPPRWCRSPSPTRSPTYFSPCGVR